jgi:hypothetical protein
MNDITTEDLRMVADRVMGWKTTAHTVPEGFKNSGEAYIAIHHNKLRRPLALTGKDAWNPVENPADFQELLEACGKILGSTQSIGIRWDDGQWIVLNFDAPNFPKSYGDTLPLALTKFAIALARTMEGKK